MDIYKEHPFSALTNSGRAWRKMLESDAQMSRSLSDCVCLYMYVCIA